jgi:hypothetical protein
MALTAGVDEQQEWVSEANSSVVLLKKVKNGSLRGCTFNANR